MVNDIELSWDYVASLSEEYSIILNREKHNHPLIKVDGVIRWKHDPLINYLKKMNNNKIYTLNLNNLFALGASKNDPMVRELYRKIGYSLYGYWEVFYWCVNNELADEYNE